MASYSRKRAPTTELVRLRDEHRASYEQFMKRTHKGTRFYDQESMEKLGVHEEITRMTDIMGLTSLLQTPFHSYPELTSELLSTFEYHEDANGRIVLKFQLGNAWRRMTLEQFNAAFGLPFGYEYQTKYPQHFRLFWYKITGNPSALVRDFLAADMIHPCFKIIQRLLGNTIYGRAECTKMRLGELACLWAMVKNEPFDLGYEFAGKLLELSKTTKGQVMVGGLIARLADCFGVDLTGYTEIKFSLINIRHLVAADIIVEKNRVYYNYIKKLKGERKFSSRRIRTTRSKAWYDDWVGEHLPPHPLEEEEEFDFEEDESEEEEAGADEDDAGDQRMFDAPVLPSARFEQGGSSGGHGSHGEEDRGSYGDQIRSLYERMGELQVSVTGIQNNMETHWRAYEEHRAEQERRQQEMYQMQSQMYYQTMGAYFDPSVPFPPPPPDQ